MKRFLLLLSTVVLLSSCEQVTVLGGVVQKTIINPTLLLPISELLMEYLFQSFIITRNDMKLLSIIPKLIKEFDVLLVNHSMKL